MSEETVDINGEIIPLNELEAKKKKLKEQNIELVEVGNNKFKTRMHD